MTLNRPEDEAVDHSPHGGPGGARSPWQATLEDRALARVSDSVTACCFPRTGSWGLVWL